jgi:NADH-quinone oxidoreductase subunit J
VGLIITAVARNAPVPDAAGTDPSFWVHVMVALVAVAGAARMVTHPRPVYAALYFVLVILAVSVNFLLLQAEFMAFALLIVYAGAILITYLFVLMLAQQSGDQSTRGETAAWYDRTPREPIAALVLAFIMLSATGDALFRRENSVPWLASPAVVARANIRAWERITDVAKLERGADGRLVSVDPSGTTATITLLSANGDRHPITLDGTAAPANSTALGHALVAQFPVSLELAGVILLMALFGAVVLARRQMAMAEDERRAAAGLPRIDDSESLSRGGAA